MKKHRLQATETPQWDEELRHWLETYIAQHPHLTTEVLSRSHSIGVSRIALDKYLEGTYFLFKEQGGEGNSRDDSTIESAIRAYRERVELPSRFGYGKAFVSTYTWFQVKHACTLAVEENIIVLIYGKPGIGKSRCLKEFAQNSLYTPPVLFQCSRNITPVYFLQKIALELGVNERQKLPRLEDALAEKLKRYPRPLFIDQANYLNEKSLGSVCYIWEMAHIPIVLSGTKNLYDLFTTSPLTEDVRAQLSSRVAMHYLLAELSLAEAKAIIQRALAEDATDEIVAQIFSITGGIHRHLDMILPRILDLKSRNEEELKAGKITLREIIMTAGSRLMT